MAHDRSGPDVVMNIRYAGVSEIRAVTDHEIHRTPDGPSAIDPTRSHLNRVLHGPSTQQQAVELMWKKGVRPPAAQSESPYVQTVVSASASFFHAHDDEGQIVLDQDKIDLWVKETMTWLESEYGADLAHVSLHLDETTPHLHVLIVPTYTRKSRQPSRRSKSGETVQDFEVRLEAWKKSSDGVRTAGRSSSEYWSKIWCRRDARKAYHAAVEHLGLGYGRDFVEEGQPSPEHILTGMWVRQQAADFASSSVKLSADLERVKAERADLSDQREILDREVKIIASERSKITSDRHAVNCSRDDLASERVEFDLKVEQLKLIHAEIIASRKDLAERHAEVDETERQFIEVAREIDEDRNSVKRAISSVMRVVRLMADTIGIKISGRFERDLRAISDELSAKNAIQNPSLDDGPGF